MKLAHGFLLVAGGYALRLGAGMVVFVVLARWLGPTAFGQFVYWLAIATLLSMPVNFGFGSMVLRSFGMRNEHAATTMQDVLTAKLVLAFLIIVLGVMGLALIGSIQAKWIFLFLLFAQVCESFSEYYTLGFRVNAHFTKETITASIVSALHIATMLIVTYVSQDIVIIAAAFALSRLAGLVLTRIRCQLLLGKIKIGPFSHVGKTLKDAWAYAFELGLLTTYGQIDTLIINHMLGPAAVGLYQAGMKLVQGASRIAPVLALVVLPTLSKQSQDAAEFRRIGIRAMAIFVTAGALGGAVMAFLAQTLTHVLFGNAYVELTPLLPVFGLLLFLRFTETGMGLLLVARGQQTSKVWFVAIQLALVVVGGTIALGAYGLAGWQWVNVLSVSLLLLSYGWLLMRRLTHIS